MLNNLNLFMISLAKVIVLAVKYAFVVILKHFKTVLIVVVLWSYGMEYYICMSQL